MEKILASSNWSDTEELRVAISEYKGKVYFGARIWYLRDGVMLPGKQGINVPLERIAEFGKVMRKGLDAADKEAKKGGAK